MANSELVELQTQLAFQEDLVASLNEALSLQQQELSALREEFELLKQQYRQLREEMGSGSGVADNAMEKPPHY